jgi:hypothetical protein
MHGCGVRLSKDASGGMKALEGKFFADEYVGPILPCSSQDCLDAAVEADVAAHQAQSYRMNATQQQQEVRCHRKQCLAMEQAHWHMHGEPAGCSGWTCCRGHSERTPKRCSMPATALLAGVVLSVLDVGARPLVVVVSRTTSGCTMSTHLHTATGSAGLCCRLAAAHSSGHSSSRRPTHRAHLEWVILKRSSACHHWSNSWHRTRHRCCSSSNGDNDGVPTTTLPFACRAPHHCRLALCGDC